MWAGIVIGLILGIFLNRLMIILGILGIIALIIIGVTISKSKHQTKYFTANEVNLRNSPNISAEIISKIRPGEEVFFMSDSTITGNTTWYKVLHGFEKGWVNKKLLIQK